jgi:hypothetical protein
VGARNGLDHRVQVVVQGEGENGAGRADHEAQDDRRQVSGEDIVTLTIPAGTSQSFEVGLQAPPLQLGGIVAVGLEEVQAGPDQGRQVGAEAAQPQNAQSIATVCSTPSATRTKALRDTSWHASRAGTT